MPGADEAADEGEEEACWLSEVELDGATAFWAPFTVAAWPWKAFAAISASAPETATTPVAIQRVVEEIRAATGRPVRGWLGPGLRESARTLDLLRANGVEYVCDWVNDDQPYRMNNGLYSIPYSLDLNDMRLLVPPVFGFSDWCEMIRRAFDTLYAEGGRVMCIPVHPYVTGQPSRIGAFAEVLSYITGHDGVWRTTGGEIFDAYRAQRPEVSPTR